MISTAILRQLARFILPPVHGAAALAALKMWWTGMLIEPLMIFRAFQTKLLSKFSLFYTYIMAVWLSDVLLYFV